MSYKDHIVMWDRLGKPVDPTGNINCKEDNGGWCDGKHTSLRNYNQISDDQFNQHLDGLIRALPKDKRKVLIFFHGGLNTQVETVQRVADINQEITNFGYFPIFINWQSSLITSYFDHLLHIRQGEYWGESDEGKWAGLLTAPFYFLGDIARSIARAPVVMGLMIRNDIQTVPPLRSLHHRDWINAKRIGNELFCQYNPESHDKELLLSQEEFKEWRCPKGEGSELVPIPIWLGRDERTDLEMALAVGRYAATFPTKLVLSPFLDAMGKRSWDTMLRSGAMLSHTEDDYGTEEQQKKKGIPPKQLSSVIPSWPLRQLLKKLEDFQQQEGPLDITLVGHSMGAIELNHLIRLSEQTSSNLKFNTIVYMAAACSIRDYEATILPYLRKNPGAQFYHLTLHEYSESREAWDPTWTLKLDLPPRGSLLVWIDNFLAEPANPGERTVGRFTNLILAAHHEQDNGVRKRIHIKKFRAGLQSMAPLKHGDFAKPFRFWNEKCWDPDFPTYRERGELVSECLQNSESP